MRLCPYLQICAMALTAALVSCAGPDLPPEPTPHLTPPTATPAASPRQDSADALPEAPAPSARSRSIDTCSPCDLVPWVPMARALNLDSQQHYALSVPAVPIALPVSYGIPVTRLQGQQSPPPQQYGPPHSAGDSGTKNIEHAPENKPGLPPPPLPQFAYGPPQPVGQTQHTSESNVKPTAQKFAPPPPPAFLNYQLLPSMKFGPPFHSKPPALPNPPKPPASYLPQNPPPPGLRLVSQNLQHQQQQEGSMKTPFFLHNPIPFPTMSKTQLPPLFNYQTFHDGKRTQLYPFLQPPKPQNVVVTITETEDCKKCQEQNQSSDSEPAQAELVTENAVSTTEKHKEPALEPQKPNIQVVKSVPLAEYLASVEYPMQIVQAPILDVPELSKYFNLGYHNFPQVPRQQGNGVKLQDQNLAHSFALPNKQNSNHYNYNFNFPNKTIPQQPQPTNLDDVTLPEDQNSDNLPHNHKQNFEIASTNEDTTESGVSHTTVALTQATTRPSQIYHINKITSLSTPGVTISSTEFPVTQESQATGGHFVTSDPSTELQPPKSDEPAPFQEPIHSSSQNQPLTASGGDRFPSGPVNYRYNGPPPPISSGSLGDWALHPYGRGWGNTLPQPFVMPTNSPHRARFEVRPTPAPGKKAKHIHQIIIPYTTNKQVTPVAQEPNNNIGWTPIPPTNQGRKVPANNDFSDFPSSTGLDQSQNHQNIGPTGNSHDGTNVPLSASGTDSSTSQHVLPLNNGQGLNLPPHVINQILHNSGGGVWPSGTEGLQQLLATNLQSLLRGEEDSIDIASLQKNIDNWTAEGYKQNSPSVNYIPATTISHIFNSKKIPDEYLTSTETSVPPNPPETEERPRIYHHSGVPENDNDGAASLQHPVKVHPDPHAKDQEPLKETESSTTTPEGAVSETTSKVWENVQVSISPLTKEKVYVVTPVPTADADTVLSSRVERSYSVVSSVNPVTS